MPFLKEVEKGLKQAARKVQQWNGDLDPTIIGARSSGDADVAIIKANSDKVLANASNGQSIFDAVNKEIEAYIQEANTALKDAKEEEKAIREKLEGLNTKKQAITTLNTILQTQRKEFEENRYHGKAVEDRGVISGAPKDGKTLDEARQRASQAAARISNVKTKTDNLANASTDLLGKIKNLQAAIAAFIQEIRTAITLYKTKPVEPKGDKSADLKKEFEKLQAQMKDLQKRMEAQALSSDTATPASTAAFTPAANANTATTAATSTTLAPADNSVKADGTSAVKPI